MSTSLRRFNLHLHRDRQLDLGLKMALVDNIKVIFRILVVSAILMTLASMLFYDRVSVNVEVTFHDSREPKQGYPMPAANTNDSLHRESFVESDRFQPASVSTTPGNPIQQSTTDMINIMSKTKTASTFRKFNDANMVTVTNLCVVAESSNSTLLVAYNNRGKGGKVNHTEFLIDYRSGVPPSEFKMITDITAYFALSKFAHNIYHFFDNFLIQVYGMMSPTGGLTSINPSHVFVQQTYHSHPNGTYALHLYPGTFAENFVFYELMNQLNIKTPIESYDRMTPGVCYKNAVVQNSTLGVLHATVDPSRNRLRFQVFNHLLQSYGISRNACKEKPGDIKATLIQRNGTRVIINADEVLNTLKKERLITEMVYLEKMTFKEQIKTAVCSDIIIGVTGAGLYWSMMHFKDQFRSLIELSWSKEGWEFFFLGYAKKRVPNVSVFPIEVLADNIIVKSGNTFTSLSEYKASHSGDVGMARLKGASVKVDINDFKKALRSAISNVRRHM